MTEVEKLSTDFKFDVTDNEDAELEEIAIQRLNDDKTHFVPFDEVLKKFNITQSDIDAVGDVEFE